jgi:predicted membrane protein
MKFFRYLFFVVPGLFLCASNTFAQSAATIASSNDVFQRVVDLIFVPMYKLALAITALYFFYGIAHFMYYMNDPEKKNLGKQHLLWGSIGMFIILSIGGIISILGGLFGGLTNAFGG